MTTTEFFASLDEAEEGVYVTRQPPEFPGALVRQLAEACPQGLWWQNGQNITWQVGRQMHRFLTPERYADLLCARAVAEELGVTLPAKAGLSKINDTLLSWAATPLPGSFKGMQWLTPPTGGGYTACRPGRYPWRRLVDVDQAYHQLLQRLPTPRVLWEQGGALNWFRLSPSEEDRWRALLAATARHKPFRVSLHGCMLGCVHPRRRCHGAETTTFTPGPGKWFGAAILVVRSLYELVGLEAERTQTPFAATDCLMLGQGERPQAWEAVGLRSSERAAGETEVVNPGTYRCGSKQTKLYSEETGDSSHDFRNISRLPERLLYPAWL